MAIYGTMKKRLELLSLSTAKIITYTTIIIFFVILFIHFGSLSSRLAFPATSISPTPSSNGDNQDNNRQKQKHAIRWDPQTSIRRVPSDVTCDRSHHYYDLCTINGPTVLDPTTSTIFIIGPTRPNHFTEKIRPYPRKWEKTSMAKTKEVTLVSTALRGPTGPTGPTCDVVHNSPALVFSAGGYTGNFFHDFNEGFIPVFITIRSLSSLSSRGRDIVLVIEDVLDWWVKKYGDLLGVYSKHPIVNLENDNSTHCFTSTTTVGLVAHGFLTIDPKLMPGPTTLLDFHNFLDKAYTQAQNPIIQAHNINVQNVTLKPKPKPRLVLISRPKRVGRALINQDQVQTLAEQLGFNVIVFESKLDTPVSEAYKIMNGSHAVVGVHGAAMTHLLFMRPGSVFIQVVPIGTDWAAELCYGKPAKEMGLDYLEYKVKVEESSLLERYHKYDPIITDPKSVQKGRWAFINVYLRQQDVKLDLYRFRGTLKKAYRKAKKFMKKVDYN